MDPITSAMRRHWRRLLLTGVFACLAPTALFLSWQMQQTVAAANLSDSLYRREALVANVRTDFDSLRYWLADLATTSTPRSEVKAAEARKRLDQSLETLSRIDQETGAAIGAEARQFERVAKQAADAYAANRRDVGDRLFAEARVHGLTEDGMLSEAVQAADTKWTQARAAVGAAATLASRLAWAAALGATIAALAACVALVLPLAGASVPRAPAAASPRPQRPKLF